MSIPKEKSTDEMLSELEKANDYESFAVKIKIYLSRAAYRLILMTCLFKKV